MRKVTWAALVLLAASLARPVHAEPEAEWQALDLDLHYRTRVHRTLGFVRGIAQTPDGYLWFATSFGLARYDGVRFDFFDSSNTPAIKDDHLMGLVAARQGGLWLATRRGGLVRYQDGSFTHVPIGGLAEDTDLCCLAEDDQGALWVGTNIKGLHRYKDGLWERFKEAGSAVFGIWPAEDHALLFQIGRHWVRVRGGALERVPADEYGDNAWPMVLRHVLPAKAPPLDAAIFDDVRGKPLQASHVTRDGTVWLGLSGLTRIDERGRRTFRVSDGVASENILTIFEDREGNVWAGHYGTGVTQLTRVPFFSFSGREGFGGGAAFSLAEAKNGTVWISQSNGLTEVRAGRYRNWWPSPSQPLWGLRSLAIDSKDRLWMVLIDRGLGRLDGEQLTTIALPQGQGSRFATALHIGADDAVWVALGAGGLVRWSDERFEPFPLPELGPHGCEGVINVEYPCPQAVNVIHPRQSGGFWLGTTQKGLWQWAPGSAANQVPGKTLSQATVFALVEETEGKLWVGTDRGLFVIAEGQTRHLTRRDGLASEGVFSLLDDGQGRLWMGSERGVYNVTKAQLNAVLKGSQMAVDAVSYRALDGLPSDEFIRRFEPTAIKTRDGRLWWSAVAGVAIFLPPDQIRQLPPPKALLERTVLKHRVFTPPWPQAPVQIPPGTGDLEFHYTAPAFAAPHHLRFQYKLEGFDKEWVRAGTRRAAYYTNIPPGPYKFRVKADTALSGASDQEASFALVLRPRFTETIWFYLALAAMVVLAAVTVQRMRIRSVKAKFAAVLDERNRIARDLHDTLAQVFSAIGFQIDAAAGLAGQDAPVLKERLKRVRQMVAHARLAARNVIWNLRQADGEPSSIPSLVSKLEAIPPLYDKARIVVNVAGPPCPLPASVENELFHIAQEAVSNAVEHGKAELISIELEVGDGRLEMLIHDDGVGFKPPANAPEGPRFGLRGMRERAVRIGADLTMHAEPDVGTEISVSVPLARAVPKANESDPA